MAHTLSDERLVARLRDLNGTPEEILAEPDLRPLILPIVRADFALCDSYVYMPAAALDCAISAFGGVHDPATGRAELEAWGAETRAVFSLTMLHGDHFFLHTARGVLLRSLARELETAVAAR